MHFYDQSRRLSKSNASKMWQTNALSGLSATSYPHNLWFWAPTSASFQKCIPPPALSAQTCGNRPAGSPLPTGLAFPRGSADDGREFDASQSGVTRESDVSNSVTSEFEMSDVKFELIKCEQFYSVRQP